MVVVFDDSLINMYIFVILAGVEFKFASFSVWRLRVGV